MANPSKAQILADIQTLLKKRYKVEPIGAKFNILESIIYAICQENATQGQAERAFSKFKSDFFDWNEVRVSSIEEIRAVFKGMPDDEERAHRLRRFLRQLFEKTYGFNLEALAKKPLKDSLKTLSEYEAFESDYIVAEVSRLGLGGHAIGLDKALLRVLDRLGLGSTDGDVPALRGSVERAVPKNRGAEFAVLMSELAADVCVPGEPKCPACELRKTCPTGLAPKPLKLPEEPKKAAKASSPSEKGKPSKPKEPEAASPAPPTSGKASGKPAVAAPAPPPFAVEKPKEKSKAVEMPKPPEKADAKAKPNEKPKKK